jgi:hypothetical protein
MKKFFIYAGGEHVDTVSDLLDATRLGEEYARTWANVRVIDDKEQVWYEVRHMSVTRDWRKAMVGDSHG